MVDLKRLIPSTADIDVAAAFLGVKFEDQVSAWVKSMAPDIDFVQKYGGILAGWGLYKLGGDIHPLLSAFGLGVLLSAAQDIVVPLPFTASPAPSSSSSHSSSPSNALARLK